MALRSWKDYIETIAIPRLHLIDTAVLALTSEYRLIGMMGGKCKWEARIAAVVLVMANRTPA